MSSKVSDGHFAFQNASLTSIYFRLRSRIREQDCTGGYASMIVEQDMPARLYSRICQLDCIAIDVLLPSILAICFDSVEN